jgi:hypothetical protein
MRRSLIPTLPLLAALVFAASETAPKLDFDKVDPHKMLTDRSPQDADRPV